MILKLNRSLTPYFWLNINDSDIAFNGIIEYSNLNRDLKVAGNHIAYIPYYLPIEDERFRYTDDQLFDEYLNALRKIVPAFEFSWIRDYRVFRSPLAQIICTLNFSRQVPEFKSPVSGLYVTDSSQLYPEDRTISGTICIAKSVADLIVQQN